MNSAMRSVSRSGLLFLLANALLFSQTSKGTVSGFVTDPSSSAASAAAVELHNTDTDVVRKTTTNDSGLYRFDAVDPGNYRVVLNLTGFRTTETAPFVVAAGSVETLDVQLQVGDQKTVVTVTSEAAVLQTESPVRGGAITAREAVQLPISNRNAASLALTIPGVSTNRYGFGNDTFSVNGSRGRSNNFLLDGTENNDISVAGQAFELKIPDAVQETTVQTSNFDSEYGRAGGAVVNVITRSGTNSFHGTASYLLDSTIDDAISNLQRQDPNVVKRGHPLPGTEQIWAGTLGGPILRNRAFFFVAYQEDRQKSSSSLTVTVPTSNGWATLNNVFPQGTNKNVDLYRQVTGSVLATTQTFPVALGNNRSNVEFGTGVIPYAATGRDREYLVRIDHRLAASNFLGFRYAVDDTAIPVASINFPGFDTSQANKFHNVLLSDTHTFSPSLTNELRLSYNRIELSFPVDTKNPLGQTLPQYAIAGLNSFVASPAFAFGVQSNLPQGRIANNYGLQDTITWVHGTHSVRAGLDLLDQQSRQFAPITQRGFLDYRSSSAFTGLANFVDDFGGSGGSAQRDFGSAAYYPKLFRQQYFIQDRWRATSDLTVTLGLRYEYFGVPVNSVRTPAFTGLFNIDPATLNGPYNQPDKVDPDKNNFSPSVGLAWAPPSSDPIFGDRKTVLRVGYQIGYDSFFNNIASNAQTSSPNIVSTLTTSTVTTANPRGLPALSAGIPAVPRALSPADSQTLVMKNLVNPYYQKWSFGLERELPSQIVLDVSYVGTKGTKLFATEDLNPLVPAALQHLPAGTVKAGFNLTGRLDPLQGARNIRTNGGSSTYNAFQSELNRRFGNGMFADVSYTRSKLIDYGSEIFATSGISNPTFAAIPTILGGLPREKGPSLFDRPNRLTAVFDYQVPLFKSQRGLFGHILGGWETSGIYTYESGVPYTVTNGLDADGIGGANDRPDFNPQGQVGVRAVPSATSPTGYINPDRGNAPIDPRTAEYIVLAAGSGRTGNLGRNTLRTPPTDNLNANILKNIRITERFSLEFRTEFYNILNHQQFGQISVSPFAPGTSPFSSGSAGTLQANANTSPPGRFLDPTFLDGGSRVIRYQLKLVF